ncbi:MAG: MFS transporter [Clostridia bacterium]|nr:MFS transporter [Clostridia bacterium]
MLNIFLLGLVSFFSDFSSEMAYPLIPLYLTGTFGATPALVGVIEGMAESAASLLKVFSGYVTDRYRHKKPVAFCGYAAGLVYKLALIAASSWAGILAARVIDRIGKGIRTAPRDVLVGESADGEQLGGAFGIHKALDMAGSAGGIITAYFFATGTFGSFTYRGIFAISAVPAVVGLALLLFVKEKNGPRMVKIREPFWKNLKSVDTNLKLYLLTSLIFTLGNSSNTFLLLRAKSVGFTDTNVVLLYFAYNLTAAVFSIPFGRLSDRIGRKKVLAGGYLVFSAVYLGFAFAENSGMIIAVFVLYGFYTAMTAGVERALITEISPPELKGTMLGLQATIVGVALLPASVAAGLLWDALGAAAPFIYGASLSLAAAAMLAVLLNRKRRGGN